MSNIKVFVDWERSSVFAGEDLNCTITFTNVATVSNGSRSPSPTFLIYGHGSGRDRWRKTIHDQQKSDLSRKSPLVKDEPARSHLHKHQSTLSSSQITGSTTRVGPSTQSKIPTRSESRGEKHQRSVSIVSKRAIATGGDGDIRGNPNPSPQVSQHLGTRHGRAASLQSYVRRIDSAVAATPETILTKLTVTPPTSKTPCHAKPTLNRVSPSIGESSPSKRAACVHRAHQITDNDFRDIAPSNNTIARSSPVHSSFELPKEVSIGDISSFLPTLTKGKLSNALETTPPGNTADCSNFTDRTRPLANILSPVSRNGTPRSSVDLYTASNNSAETLASEYIAHTTGRQPTRVLQGRQPPRLAPIVSHTRPSEILMMGYVQIVGAFTLDGSLISLSPFEEIKRKGVIGGQGSGGVVGVEPTKKHGGLFGTLGWGSIGESLGGFLGASEPSSIREMKNIASTKSIPIISTPQSILFVDMRLDPGESRSYSYRHALPRGIPPSHKGRAMKVTYNLVIGTQRAQSKAQQHLVRHVEIPFRVLPGVNGTSSLHRD